MSKQPKRLYNYLLSLHFDTQSPSLNQITRCCQWRPVETKGDPNPEASYVADLLYVLALCSPFVYFCKYILALDVPSSNLVQYLKEKFRDKVLNLISNSVATWWCVDKWQQLQCTQTCWQYRCFPSVLSSKNLDFRVNLCFRDAFCFCFSLVFSLNTLQ